MRQLAAIVFADMTGFTALMQENEHLARKKRDRMKQVLGTEVNRFNGKILQYYGDGSLSIFNSAIQAVEACISMQQQWQFEPKVEMRIGIHLGDIVMEEETIFGDGVNLASRIESLSIPGAILVSEKIYDEVKNQQNIRCREMGYFELKNIKEPVRVFAVINEGIVVPSREELKGKSKQPENRLAVLPFVNMSADPENEYFSDGITEELLNALSKVEGMQVTSRTSAFAFKGKQDDIREIASKLNVDRILEGSVRKAGSRVRITAQLINAADGYHIWSETFDRNLTDIFEVQDEISNIISNKLRENLAATIHAEQGNKTQATNVEAYTLYLKAIHYWNKVTPADAKKAIECLEQVIEMEPGYAKAYAGIAAAFSYLGATGQLSPDMAFANVHKFSDKALELDDTIGDGYISKGSAYIFYDWDLDKAYEYLKKGMELSPGSSSAAQLMSFYYISIGQRSKAVEILEEALRKDPLSPIINFYLAEAYVINKRFDDAIRIADRILELQPDMRAALETKGWATGLKGDWEKAKTIFEEVYRLTGHPLKGISPMGYAYGKLGMIDKANECLAKLEQRKLEFPEQSIDGDFVVIYAGMGDADKVFQMIDGFVSKRAGPVRFYIQHPLFDFMRTDPRWNELQEKLELLTRTPVA